MYHITEETIAGHYNKYARAYKMLPDSDIVDVENMLNGRQGSSLLDIGCASGKLIFNLAETGRYQSLTGIDISDEELLIAQSIATERNLSNCTFLKASALDLPFADSTFDIVVSNRVWQLLDNMEMAFREANRVLKSNGFALVQIISSAENEIMPEFDSLLRQAWEGHLPEKNLPSLFNRITVDEAEIILQNAGISTFEINLKRTLTNFDIKHLDSFINVFNILAGFWMSGIDPAISAMIDKDMRSLAHKKYDGQPAFPVTGDVITIKWEKA
jgi:ubiquinone/menaquinone biosynthesis C-methylase UbiE